MVEGSAGLSRGRGGVWGLFNGCNNGNGGNLNYVHICTSPSVLIPVVLCCGFNNNGMRDRKFADVAYLNTLTSYFDVEAPDPRVHRNQGPRESTE